MWTRVENGRCVEFISFNPEGIYPAELIWLEVPQRLRAFVDHNYLIDNGIIIPPSRGYILSQAHSLLAKRRWREETSGTALPEGRRVPTGDRDKNLLTGARFKTLEEVEAQIAATVSGGGTIEEGRAAGLAITHTLDAGGQPVTATNAEFLAMSKAFADHVQACFDRWGVIWRKLDEAATWQEVVAVYAEEIDQGWPEQAATAS